MIPCHHIGHLWGQWSRWEPVQPKAATYAEATNPPVLEPIRAVRHRQCRACGSIERMDYQGKRHGIVGRQLVLVTMTPADA